jgi:O-antigen/teichoic acid export membrane protein
MFNGPSNNFRVGLTYALGDFLVLGTRFALSLVYAIYLSSEGYGILAVTTAIFTIMGVLVGFGLKGAAFQQFFQYTDPKEIRSFYGSLWLFMILSGALLTLGVDLIWGANFPNAFSTTPYDPYIRLALWSSYLNGFGVILYEIYRSQQLPGRYAVLAFGNGLTLAVSGLYFVALQNQGVQGALVALLLTGLVWAIIYTLAMIPHMSLHFDLRKLRKALAYSLPLMPHFLAYWLLSLSDRVVLERTVPIADVGVYALGYNLGNMQQVVSNAGNSALMPAFGRAQSDKNKIAKLSEQFSKYIALMAVSTLGISIFADQLVPVFFPQVYETAGQIAPLVALSFFCLALYYGPMNAVVLLGGNTRHLWLITLAAGAINLGSNILFVPRYGIQAAAVNLLISYLILFLLIFWYSRKQSGPSFEWKYFWVISAGLIGGILVDRGFMATNFWQETFLDVLILAIFVGFFFRRWTMRKSPPVTIG